MAQALAEAEADVDDDWMGQMDAQLRYYLHLSQKQLDRLSMDDWIRLWSHLKHIRAAEAAEKT